MKTVINVAVIGKGAMGRTHSASIAMLKYSFKNMPFEVKLHTLVLRSEENMREEADALGFVGTPYFLVNDLVVRGALSLEDFSTAVDMALAKKAGK